MTLSDLLRRLHDFELDSRSDLSVVIKPAIAGLSSPGQILERISLDVPAIDRAASPPAILGPARGPRFARYPGASRERCLILAAGWPPAEVVRLAAREGSAS